jgi:hypothetical protein
VMMGLDFSMDNGVIMGSRLHHAPPLASSADWPAVGKSPR